ncbi:MAG: NB-ARC domain-containing protein, partial [Planktothrix sp.]
EIDIPESTEGKISLLIEQLNSSPCLIILDDAEHILQSGCSGKYIPEYDDYGLFFEVVGESQHQSCLVVISQEKIREISLSAQLSSQVHQFFLEGLNAEEVEELLQEQGLKGTATHWQELVHDYGGNPLALKLLSLMIIDIFQGEIGDFLKHRTIVIKEGFREILDHQFHRLSDTQKQILSCLAEAGKPLSLKDLQEKLSDFLSLSKILEPLESLLGRSLVEKIQHQPGNEVLFGLQPLIQKYIKQH